MTANFISIVKKVYAERKQDPEEETVTEESRDRKFKNCKETVNSTYL